MNKIVCPHCKNINILNNNIKVCVFKCPCCGKEVTVNNCCKGACNTVKMTNNVYAIVGTFCFVGGITETRTIKLFADYNKAADYIANANEIELLKSYKWFERTEKDYIETFYAIEVMKVEQ